jgi:hypothetical protein
MMARLNQDTTDESRDLGLALVNRAEGGKGHETVSLDLGSS